MLTKPTDANGDQVIAFTGRIRNLERVAELTHSIIEMAESEAWRDYTTAAGRELWRDAEFDYFLIACQMQRDDVARVLAWSADSAKLAPLMDRDAPPDRRRGTGEAANLPASFNHPRRFALAVSCSPAGEAQVAAAASIGLDEQGSSRRPG